jgi:hypothetical protein
MGQLNAASADNIWMRFAVVLIAFVGLLTKAADAAAPRLVGLDYNAGGGRFHLGLSGEPNVTYTIEGSTDLQSWRPVSTNSDTAANRLVIIFRATNSHGFYRCRPILPVFAHALAAEGMIDPGGGLTLDSFDSSNPNYSTNGQYDPSKANDDAEVATASTSGNAIDIGNATIMGSVRTGPAGGVSLGPQGSVGSAAWVLNPNNSGRIEPGHMRQDMLIRYPDAHVPFNGGAFTPGAGIVGGTNYTYVFQGFAYQMANLNLAGPSKAIVTSNATLYVVGNVTLTGDAAIYITPGASFKMYVGGTASIGGQGIRNSGNATNLALYALATSTSLTLNLGTNDFAGTIYAPNADCTINGGGDFTGAVVGRTITTSGLTGFHYDENLKVVGPKF